MNKRKTILQPLPKYRTPDYEVLTAKVSNRSTIDVCCILYTVPSRLIGRQLELRLYHDRILGYLERHQVVELPRKRVSGKGKRRGRCINYRHVIGSLRLKPRAFIYCTWQSDLLPNPEYRQIWQLLQAQFDLEQAAKIIVEGLYIAAIQDKEQAVADYLQQQLHASSLTLNRLKKQFEPPQLKQVPDLSIEQHSLALYDKLLPSCSTPSKPLSTPEPLFKKAKTFPHADPLGIYRIPSYAGKLVLCSILTGLVRNGGPTKRTSSPQTRPHRSQTTKRKKFYQL